MRSCRPSRSLRSLGAEGMAAGRAAELAEVVCSTLRRAPTSGVGEFPHALAALAAVPGNALMAAALACVDEQNLLRPRRSSGLM